MTFKVDAGEINVCRALMDGKGFLRIFPSLISFLNDSFCFVVIMVVMLRYLLVFPNIPKSLSGCIFTDLSTMMLQIINIRSSRKYAYVFLLA